MDRVFYATRARRAVIAFLRSDRRYRTVAEIHRHVAAEQPTLARSTIYRALEALEGLGGVSRRLGDEKEVSFVFCGDEHHHHAICDECGGVEDVACHAIERIRESLARQRAFELDDHTIEFHGRCARCATKRRTR